jgi:hypothetical protein
MIARAMPAAVIDGLEVVHVDDRNGQRLSQSPSGLERSHGKFRRTPPIRQTRQRILVREHDELSAVSEIRKQEVTQQCDDRSAQHG